MHKIIVDKKKFRFCMIIENKNPSTPSPHIFTPFCVLLRPCAYTWFYFCVLVRVSACVCVRFGSDPPGCLRPGLFRGSSGHKKTRREPGSCALPIRPGRLSPPILPCGSGLTGRQSRKGCFVRAFIDYPNWLALAWQPVSAYPLHLNQATLDFIKNGFHQSMSYYTSDIHLIANIFLRRDTGGFLRSGMCWIKKWGLAPPGVCLFPWRNYLVEIRYLRTITFATPNVKGAGS